LNSSRSLALCSQESKRFCAFALMSASILANMAGTSRSVRGTN
jgi:hypothetical protein